MILNWLNDNYQKSLNVVLAVLVFFVPLSKAMPNIILIPASLLYLFNIYKKKEFKQPLFWYLLFLMVLSFVINAVFVGDLINEINYLKKSITGLFLFILIKESQRINLIEKSFLLGITLAIFYSLSKIFLDYLNGISFSLGSGKDVNMLLVMERPYFAFATVLANFLILLKIRKNQYSRYFYIPALFLTVFCFFISARLGIILHTLLLIHHGYRTVHRPQLKHFLVLISIIGLIVFSLIKNPYLKERMRISDNIDTTIKKLKAYEPRFIIWGCSFELIRDNYLVGLHSHYNLQHTLDNCYRNKISKERKLRFYTNSGFNTHNQLFDVLLVGGILSSILFVAAFSIPFIRYYSYDQMLTVFLLFIAFFMVENVFLRQTGCFLFGIFTSLSFKYDR